MFHTLSLKWRKVKRKHEEFLKMQYEYIMIHW